MEKIITVCACPQCGTTIDVPIRKLGQLISAERKELPTIEFMRSISRKGVEARKNKRI